MAHLVPKVKAILYCHVILWIISYELLTLIPIDSSGLPLFYYVTDCLKVDLPIYIVSIKGLQNTALHQAFFLETLAGQL